MSGISIVHRTLRSTVALIPIPSKPFTGQSLDRCPTCQVVHPVKTVHLWLDDVGACIVSQGVLADLKSVGMPNLDIVGGVVNPPPLQVGITRAKVDNINRRIVEYRMV